MKLRKHSLSLIALVLGITIFAGAVFADFLIGSGYQQLKEALRQTSYQMSLASGYTLCMELEITVDGESWMSRREESTWDGDSRLSYSHSYFDSSRFADRIYEHYSIYNLNNQELLSWSVQDGDLQYNLGFIMDYGNDPHLFSQNPLSHPLTYDLEKVLDALVGNLSGMVQVTPQGQGKEFVATFNESQVPIVAQAIASYLAKEASGAYSYYSGSEEELDMDHPLYLTRPDMLPFTEGASISSVRGHAVTNGDGVLTYLSISVTLNGNDTTGRQHQMMVSAVMSISDIDTTYLVWPDVDRILLENKIQDSRPANRHQVMQNREAGVYKADIVLDAGSHFLRIGERVLELEVDAEIVRGHYREVFIPGFENYADTDLDEFTFELSNTWKVSEVSYSTSMLGVMSPSSYTRTWAESGFTVIDKSGLQRSGYFDLYGSANWPSFWVEPAGDAVDGRVYRLDLQRVFD